MWVLLLNGTDDPRGFAGLGGVRVLPLEIEEGFPRYYFAGKVYACSRAEELAGDGVRSRHSGRYTSGTLAHRPENPLTASGMVSTGP